MMIYDTTLEHCYLRSVDEAFGALSSRKESDRNTHL
jgi:hypothetical protein